MRANEQAPVIVKKIKKGGGDGHHGGAWKVAYADFVTAMMAFFLLMWLLNATTEKQRKGLADYFNPSIPISRVSGGGAGALNGETVLVEQTKSETGMGGSAQTSAAEALSEWENASEETKLAKIEDMLTARGGESMASDRALRHIVTRVTDEGLLIELIDLEGEPLFEPHTTRPTPVMSEIVEVVTKVFNLVTNGIAIDGHVAAPPVVIAQNQVWQLSSERASRVRLLIEAGLDQERIKRVTGHADRAPRTEPAMAIENNRIVIILLRSEPKRG